MATFVSPSRSELQFAAFLSYCPRGGTKEIERSKTVMRQLKENRAILIGGTERPISDPRAFEVGHIDLEVDGKPHTLLLVALRKDDQKEARYRYEDEFVSPTEFQWESQDSTTASSKRGRSVLEHQQTGRQIHLFVRYRSTQPFTYCGLVDFVRREAREAPLRVWFRLRNPLPDIWRAWAG